jgi:hypothetical protein
MFVGAPGFSAAKHGFRSGHVYAAMGAAHHGFGVLNRRGAFARSLFRLLPFDFAFFVLPGQDAGDEQADDHYDYPK